ncbi:hypothetical protein H257_16917 [Aphanomyces astaci]|uniref:Uncharacterized protein n=1 Tax=Aphanomyces astaci TaxID=112090 RepID=W4FGR7_APHAT|nr:hypothetical protein H257_16917 [Aphanomyces astaci]ETV66707.1 hypothetical protein H257_16917 [Aphanomyces astaci]|eukprot:XP_009843832.1 hypothetical protein H257_16917 [Aphanomyces astaci]
MAATQRHHDEWFDANFIDHRRSGSFGHSTSVADTFRAVHDTFEHENKVAREERDLNFNDNVASNADNFDGMDYQTADDNGLSSDNITAYISVLTNSRNYFPLVPVADTFRAVHDTFEHENKVAREERDLNFNDNVASNADNFDGMDYQTADDNGLSSDNITAYISVLTNSRNYFPLVPGKCTQIEIPLRSK